MRLNKSTNHAIRIMIMCSQADGALVKAAELSAQLDITLQNVFKIIHILSRSELVAPVRGPSGGVALARAPEDIRLGDIVRAMEATEFDIESEGAAGSGFGVVLDSALGAFIDVLDRHTLVDLARQSGNRSKHAEPVVKRRKKLKPLPVLAEKPAVVRVRR
jgi:Rrf2 family nitric oxide-sensitive transcriptional repressor